MPKPKGNSYRGRYRQLSDQAAHESDTPFVPPPILKHPLVCPDPPALVTTPDQLEGAIKHLISAGTFGYDTEFIGEDSYYPHLCLIQAATADRVLLIDPLTIEDLSPWWALLNDPSLCKIIHAGAQDIEPVFRLTDKPAANLFDTQVVAGLAGLQYPLSLGNTINAVLGVEHDAGAKFSKWDRRPLTPQQTHYAAGDVRYLCAIHQWLTDKLDELGNTDIAQAANEELCDPARYTTDPLHRKIKAKGVNKLPRKKRAVFNALLLWREDNAKQMNVTPRGLLADEAVYEIAQALPEHPGQLGSIKFVPRPVAQNLGTSLINCIGEAIQGPLPPKHKPSTYDRDEHRIAVNALWDRIDKRCAERSITPGTVTSKRELGVLVGAAMMQDDTPTLSVNTGWRGALLSGLIEPDAVISTD